MVTSADVGRRLGLSRTSVVRLVNQGVLRPVAKGPGIRGAYLFDLVDVELLAARRTPTRESA